MRRVSNCGKRGSLGRTPTQPRVPRARNSEEYLEGRSVSRVWRRRVGCAGCAGEPCGSRDWLAEAVRGRRVLGHGGVGRTGQGPVLETVGEAGRGRLTGLQSTTPPPEGEQAQVGVGRVSGGKVSNGAVSLKRHSTRRTPTLRLTTTVPK